MNRSIRALTLLAGVAAACAGDDRSPTDSEIAAGEAARAFDVASYRIDRTDDAISIRLVDSGGSPLATISIVDDLASRPVASDDDGEHVPRTIRLRTDDADRELLRISSPVVYLAEADTWMWHAALTDPALAPTLGERGLEFRAGRPRGWTPHAEIGYAGEYPCGYGHHGEGHRVAEDTAHAPGWQYAGCNIPVPGWPTSDQTVQWYGGYTDNSCNRVVHGIDRPCDATCCLNDNCQSAGGPGPCAGQGIGPGGCMNGEHWDTAFCEYYSPNCGAPECQISSYIYAYSDRSWYYVSEYAVWDVWDWNGYFTDGGMAVYWWTYQNGNPVAQGAYAGVTPLHIDNYPFGPQDAGSWAVIAQVVDQRGYTYWSDWIYVDVY